MSKMGRPRRECLPEYSEMLIEHMEKGFSFESFAGVLRTGKEQIYRWLEENEEFRNAKKIADMLCLLRWEKIGMAGMMGKTKDMDIKKFNAAIFCFNMKNRFGWRDKVETEIKGGGDFKITFNEAKE